MQVHTAKRPLPTWEHASNVKVPLITIAALQFQALAYPALIDAPDLVKCMVYGDDPDGSKNARADRVAAHMSWQNLEQDKGWEEAHDKGLLVEAIAGCVFYKKIYDPACGHNVTQCVLPANFVINYYTQNLDTSQRYTHTFNLTKNAIRTREIDGRFLEQEEYETPAATQQVSDDPLMQAQNERQGLTPPADSEITPYFTGEQYCWWDLDGDGYDEPYIVTFDIANGCVRRIAPRFLPSGVKLDNGKFLHDYATQDGFDLPGNLKVYTIEPVKVFVKNGFIPSPDGGFYDIGLGQILGDINESADSALNQLFDAGTMSTLGGGFLGRGFKNRAGPFSMKPYQWYPIDAPGDDLSKNILPLPIREPSPVLFQVLMFLVQYAEKITQTTEIGMGENPGQNTPAQTTQTLDQNGKRMMNAIFKRTWRATRDEYRMQYELNSLFLPESENFYDLTQGKTAMVLQTDYSTPSIDVRPAADPFIVSDTQKQQMATAVMQASQQMPGFNRYQTGLRWLKAMKVQDVQQIYPPLPKDPQTGQQMQDFPPPGPDPKMITAQATAQKVQLQGQDQQQEAMREQVKLRVDLMTQLQESSARVNQMNAQAQLFLAQAKEADAAPAIKMIYAQIESEGKNYAELLAMVKHVNDTITAHNQMRVDHSIAAMGPSGGSSSPPPLHRPMLTNGALMGSQQGNGLT